MRIIGVLFTIGVLSGAMAIRAQVEQPALQGLPRYGVTLTGTLENPVIENHSGRVVIGYDMRFSDSNGRGRLLAAQVLARLPYSRRGFLMAVRYMLREICP